MKLSILWLRIFYQQITSIYILWYFKNVGLKCIYNLEGITKKILAEDDVV